MYRGEEREVAIHSLNKKGWGVASPIEVIGGIPGERLKVKLWGKRRKAWRADLLEILSASSERVTPRCSHVPQCGGCAWQHWDYAAQLKEKQRRVARLFPEIECLPILSAVSPWQYRNKMEFSFSQNKAGERFLGLVLAGTKGHVFNVMECHLVSSWYPRLLSQVRLWWEKTGLSAYRLEGTGSLRTLTVRQGHRSLDKLVILTVSGTPEYALRREHLHQFVDAVKASLPEAEWAHLGVFLQIQQALAGSPTQFFEMHLYGKDHLLEVMHLDLNPAVSLQFKISPTAFFQPNPSQAEVLYATALRMVSFPKMCVWDLYAGCATLGMAMASRAGKVVSIELSPHACLDAESNKALNGFSNLEIVCGDVGKVLRQRQEHPDLVVVDPPRSGLGPDALFHLKTLLPREILYISCNPQTQAANIQELLAAGYVLERLQPVDQFPHTPHIETIALLSLRP